MKDGKPPGTSLPRLEAAKKAVEVSQREGGCWSRGGGNVRNDATTTRLRSKAKKVDRKEGKKTKAFSSLVREVSLLARLLARFICKTANRDDLGKGKIHSKAPNEECAKETR